VAAGELDDWAPELPESDGDCGDEFWLLLGDELLPIALITPITMMMTKNIRIKVRQPLPFVFGGVGDGLGV
jgi:hypothetical protein